MDIERLHIAISVNTNVERNTKSLVAGVRARFESHPRIIQPILDSMDAISQEFLALLESGAGDKIREMEELIDYNQGLLATLGVSHPALDNVIAICATHGESGSGIRNILGGGGVQGQGKGLWLMTIFCCPCAEVKSTKSNPPQCGEMCQKSLTGALFEQLSVRSVDQTWTYFEAPQTYVSDFLGGGC